jgi:hypothetical protein
MFVYVGLCVLRFRWQLGVRFFDNVHDEGQGGRWRRGRERREGETGGARGGARVKRERKPRGTHVNMDTSTWR